MRPSTDLFDLIHRMSDTEKQLFVRTVRQKSTDESVSIRLFDAIANQEVYNEASIVAGIDHAPLQRRFAQYKHHLYGLVLRFLTDRENEQPLSALLVSLQQSEMLVDRGLFQQAWRIVARAQEVALNIDACDVCWRALQQERNIVLIRQSQHFTNETTSEALIRIDASLQHVETVIAQLNSLRCIQRSLTVLTPSESDPTSSSSPVSVDSILGPSLQDKHAMLSVTASLLWHHIHILYFTKVDRNPRRVHDFATELMALLAHDKTIAQAFSVHLMRAAATFATACIWVEDFKGLQHAINTLRNGPEIYSFKRTAVIDALKLQSYTYEAAMRVETVHFANIHGFLEECIHALNRFAALGRQNFADELRIYVACLALLNNRFDLLHMVAADVLKPKSSSISSHKSYMRQVECITYLMDEQEDRVEALVASALRAAKRDPPPIPLLEFYKMAGQYVSEVDADKRRAMLDKHIDFSDAFADTLHPNDASSERVAPHLVWARAALSGKPLHAVYSQLVAAERAASAQG